MDKVLCVLAFPTRMKSFFSFRSGVCQCFVSHLRFGTSVARPVQRGHGGQGLNVCSSTLNHQLQFSIEANGKGYAG